MSKKKNPSVEGKLEVASATPSLRRRGCSASRRALPSLRHLEFGEKPHWREGRGESGSSKNATRENHAKKKGSRKKTHIKCPEFRTQNLQGMFGAAPPKPAVITGGVPAQCKETGRKGGVRTRQLLEGNIFWKEIYWDVRMEEESVGRPDPETG